LNILDIRTKREIDNRVKKILAEVGVKEPPLNLNEVEDFLMIHKYYYDLSDPGLLDEIKHRLRIGSRKAIGIIKKVSLKALFLPDSNQIAIDTEVPQSKEKWVTAHEIIHKTLPTHNQLLLGDTAETIDPDYHDMMEMEANYGASSLFFLQKIFTKEAAETDCTINSVLQLSKRYKNSATSTLRRFVETNNSKPLAALVSKPLAALVSKPLWLNGSDNSQRCRYYLKSPLFEKLFCNIDSRLLMAIVDSNCNRCYGGPCGSDTDLLYDVNGIGHDFLFESFFNQYDILTLVTHLK